MSHLIASDRTGRRWVLLAVDHRLKCCIWDAATETHVVQDLDEVVTRSGPLVISLSADVSGAFDALLDTLDLVASDPETASVEQVSLLASFAQSIVLPVGRRRGMATDLSLVAPMRASVIRGPVRDEIQGDEVGNKTGGTPSD